MQPTFRPLVVHSLKTKELMIRTLFPTLRPPRRPSAVRCKVDESLVVIHPRRIALVSAESAQEFEMQASKEWAISRQASANDGHGWFKL